ncbi:MAG: type IV secretory system conjugative DNA transfer family protein [Acidobacteria bacterium]|nr:type IV secretory system conjugative DNA transfer family protein [Acidobacteriota bacterium]
MNPKDVIIWSLKVMLKIIGYLFKFFKFIVVQIFNLVKKIIADHADKVKIPKYPESIIINAFADCSLEAAQFKRGRTWQLETKQLLLNPNTSTIAIEISKNPQNLIFRSVTNDITINDGTGKSGCFVHTHSMPFNELTRISLLERIHYLDHIAYTGKTKLIPRMPGIKKINDVYYLNKTQERELTRKTNALKIREAVYPRPDQCPEKLPGAENYWALEPEMENARMFNNGGYILGRMAYKLVTTGKYNSNILTIASSRSGKGVGVVIPNLLRHPGSVIVMDPKAENYFVTASKRSQFSDVYYLDPFDEVDAWRKTNPQDIRIVGQKISLNPLDIIKDNDPDIVDKANSIAAGIVERPKDERDPFWNTAAQGLIEGLIIHVAFNFKNRKDRNLVSVRKLLFVDKNQLVMMLKKGDNHIEAKHLGATIENLQKNPNQVNTIFQMAEQHLGFLKTEKVQEAVLSSNFDIFDLKKKNVSLYLIFSTEKLMSQPIYNRLFRLWISMALNAVIYTKMIPKENVLFMLDEMAKLSYMENLYEAFSIANGSGMNVWAILQTLGQLKDIYGADKTNTILENCKIKQFFGVGHDTAEYVSQLAGKTTITINTKGTSFSTGESAGQSKAKGSIFSTGSQGASSNSGTNTSNGTSENSTPSIQNLINPDEVVTLSRRNVQLIFYPDRIKNPIYANKISYYDDIEFSGEFRENPTLT